jgi:H+/Cl- antiporter ClcA
MRGSIRLSVIFVIGAILGVWSFVEPWVIDYGFGAQHQWSPSTWSNVWIGAIVTAASLVGLVVTVASGLRAAARASAARRVEPEPAGAPRS